jgi:hypothetical protein
MLLINPTSPPQVIHTNLSSSYIFTLFPGQYEPDISQNYSDRMKNTLDKSLSSPPFVRSRSRRSHSMGHSPRIPSFSTTMKDGILFSGSVIPHSLTYAVKFLPLIFSSCSLGSIDDCTLNRGPGRYSPEPFPLAKRSFNSRAAGGNAQGIQISRDMLHRSLSSFGSFYGEDADRASPLRRTPRSRTDPSSPRIWTGTGSGGARAKQTPNDSGRELWERGDRGRSREAKGVRRAPAAATASSRRGVVAAGAGYHSGGSKKVTGGISERGADPRTGVERNEMGVQSSPSPISPASSGRGTPTGLFAGTPTRFS